MPESLPTNDVPIVTPTHTEASVDKVVLRTLEKCLFVRASEVIARTVVATKGVEGQITWLTLEREFHHQLVTTAFAVCKRNTLITTNQEVKVALFDFLLGVVNGRPQSDFFDAKKTEARSNRANRERKRLGRKRARAAKREREREEPKMDSAIRRSEATRTCEQCNVRFTSRKRYSKHKCEPVPGVEPPTKSQSTEAKRSRRIRARNAAKLKKKETKSVTKATSIVDVPEKVTSAVEVGVPAKETPVPQVAANTLTTTATVTGASWYDNQVICEDCDDVAVARKHGRWPKCWLHLQKDAYYEMITDDESDG
jgi:hypothetical protein